MATKKLLKKAKPALEASKLKKVATKKAGTAKEKVVSSSKQKKEKADKKVNPVAVAKPKSAPIKVKKAATKKSVETEIAKPVIKKSKSQVKKTPIENPRQSKEAVKPKKEVAEKKVKVDASAEKETKTPKASSKAAKSAAETNNVVIPKTSTDKKVEYEPDFMKSVLDTPASGPITPTMRYSDTELQEFKDLIGKKLDSAKKELAYLQGLITRRDEMGGDETDNRYMTMEDGGMSMEREQLSQMASRQITFIDHLEKALMRIENKTYGICRVTGKLIDKARLRAVPHATLSMEAKLGINK